jgi:hypothetical protein
LETAIRWQAGQWHQVALSWDPQGKTLLFVDGQLAAQGPGVGLKPLTDFAGIRGLSLGSDVHGGSLAQGQFEEVSTFDGVLTEAEVAQDYERNAALAALGPVTPEEEAAKLAEAALLARAKTELGEGGAGQLAMSAEDYGCDLWLRIVPATSPGAVVITIHNTVPGKTYQLLSRPDMNSASWSVEQTLTGAPGQDYTQTPVSMLGRPMLFFLAVELGEFMVVASFEGMDTVDALLASVPDTMGAVGSDHFVEVLNRAIVAYEKTGSVPQGGGPFRSATFFHLQEGGMDYPTGGEVLDPRILYDHERNRWIACGLDARGSDDVLLAVSDGHSPVPLDDSNWTKHRVHVARTSDFADFPTLGLDANGVYVSVVYISSRSNVVVAIDKDLLYQGTYQAWTFPLESVAPYLRCVQPAVNFDTPMVGNYAWFVAKGVRTEDPYQGGPILYRRLQWIGGVPDLEDTWLEVTEPQPSYRNYFDLDGEDLSVANSIGAPQAGGTTKIRLTPHPLSRDRVGSRLSMAVIRDGVLWTCLHVGLDDEDGDYDGDQTGASVDRSAIQWLKLPITGDSTLSYGAHGRVFDDCPTTPHWYYDGSLMVNNAGDVVVGFSGSSEISFISAYYSWRRADGSTADRPGLIKKGEDFYNFDRWGDYSYTSLDPVDDLTFWTVQQYARPIDPNLQDFIWGTWVTATLRPQ